MTRFLLCLAPLAALAADPTLYYVGFLRLGPNPPAMSQEEGQKLQAAHMAHMEQMHRQGYLVGAGPVIGSPNMRGVFIFQTETLDKAREQGNSDPTVKINRLVIDYHAWRGPKDIGKAYKGGGLIDMQLALVKRGPNWRAGASPRCLTDPISGPFTTENDPFLGLCLFSAGTVDAAKALLDADPAVSSGAVAYEVHAWKVGEGVIPKP
jgi:uncharacterized protein YciI